MNNNNNNNRRQSGVLVLVATVLSAVIVFREFASVNEKSGENLGSKMPKILQIEQPEAETPSLAKEEVQAPLQVDNSLESRPTPEGLGNFEKFLMSENRYRLKFVNGIPFKKAGPKVNSDEIPYFASEIISLRHEPESLPLWGQEKGNNNNKIRCTRSESGNFFPHLESNKRTIHQFGTAANSTGTDHTSLFCTKGEGVAYLADKLLRKLQDRERNSATGGNKFLRELVSERGCMGLTPLSAIGTPPSHVPALKKHASWDDKKPVSSASSPQSPQRRVWPEGGLANKVDGSHELVCSWQVEPPVSFDSLNTDDDVRQYLSLQASEGDPTIPTTLLSNQEEGEDNKKMKRDKILQGFKLVTGSSFERWYDWDVKVKYPTKRSADDEPSFQFSATQYLPQDEDEEDLMTSGSHHGTTARKGKFEDSDRRNDRLYVLKNACLRPSGRLAGYNPRTSVNKIKKNISFSYQGGNDVQAMVGAANWVEESFFLHWLEDDIEELKEEPSWYIDRPLVLVPMVGEWSAHPGHALQRAGNLAWVADSAFPRPVDHRQNQQHQRGDGRDAGKSQRETLLGGGGGDFARTDVTTAYLHVQTPPGTQHSVGGEDPKCRHQHSNISNPAGGCQWKDYGFQYYTTLATTTHFMLHSRGDEGYRMFRHHTQAGRAMSEATFQETVDLLERNPVCFKEIAVWQACPFQLCATPHQGNAWPLWGWRNPKTQMKVAQRFRTCAGIEHLSGNRSYPDSGSKSITFLYSFRARDRIRSNMQDTMLLSEVRSFISALNRDPTWGFSSSTASTTTNSSSPLRHRLLVSSLEGSLVEFVAVYSQADILISPYGSGLLYGFVAPKGAIGIEISVLGVAPYTEVGINRFPMTDYGGMYAASSGYHLTAQFPSSGNRFNGRHQIPVSGLQFLLQRALCLRKQSFYGRNGSSDISDTNRNNSLDHHHESRLSDDSFDRTILRTLGDAGPALSEKREQLLKQISDQLQRSPGAHRLRRTGLLSNAKPAQVVETLLYDGNASFHQTGRKGRLKKTSLPERFHDMIHKKDGLALNLRQAKEYVLFRLGQRAGGVVDGFWRDPQDYTSGKMRPEAHRYQYQDSGSPKDPRMLSWYRFMATASKEFSGNDPRRNGAGIQGLRLDKNIHWRPELPSEAVCRFNSHDLTSLFEHEVVNDFGASLISSSSSGPALTTMSEGFHLRSSIRYFLKSKQEEEEEKDGSQERSTHGDENINWWLHLLSDHAATPLKLEGDEEIHSDTQGKRQKRGSTPSSPFLSQTAFRDLRKLSDDGKPRCLVLVYNISAEASPSSTTLVSKIKQDVSFFRSHIHAGNRIFIFTTTRMMGDDESTAPSDDDQLGRVDSFVHTAVGKNLFPDGRPEGVPLPTAGGDSGEQAFLNGGVSFCGRLSSSFPVTTKSYCHQALVSRSVSPATVLADSQPSTRSSVALLRLISKVLLVGGGGGDTARDRGTERRNIPVVLFVGSSSSSSASGSPVKKESHPYLKFTFL